MTMKIFNIIFAVMLIIFTLQITEKAFAADAYVTEGQIEAKQLDKKAVILASYLRKYNSPMQESAQDFIDASNTYNLDWKLVPAIAGVESTFGKFIPGGYNGWGWGVYGTQAIFFNSWRDAIFTVSKGLRENYLDRGYNNPYSMNKIYAASPTWGSRVDYFMKDLEKFASQFPEDKSNDLLTVLPDQKIAAVSAMLASPVIR